ncbi:SCO2583 family membrane protein [Streptomyces sp. NPDC055721]|uniref:SCO2583 family membrane protein n=1 Tax=Streptomyces sp. NPDC127132 TaxID=3345374 RepID=UPI00363E8DED
MAGRGDPPEGTPEGLPGGGEDEYRSVVFDEAFVRAARLQEFSAQERMGEYAQPVRSRASREGRTGSRQAVLLVLLILLAFGTAIYLGVRNPYLPPADQRAEPLRTTVVPLAPQGAVPGGSPEQLFSHSPVAEYRTGAAGINLPVVGRTSHFAESQVVSALSIAKDYLVASSLDPDVLSGASVRPVRLLLDPDQLAQFDRSVESPADDGRHALAGWLVRFDPRQAVLAEPATRVQGTLRFEESAPDTLDVTADHTYTYALRPATGGVGPVAAASLFTVHRVVHFRFDREDLRMHRAELVASTVEAGPQACGPGSTGILKPLLAGARAPEAGGPAVTDPYATTRPAAPSLCGALAPSAQPSL